MIEFRSVTHVYKRFPRPGTTALSDFSLVVQAGEVLGIAGPNGAGKSTLIALALGFIHPTKGEVRIDGQSPRQFVERAGVSYLPELITINREWKTEEALLRLAALDGLGRDARRRTDEVMERLGLAEHRNKLIRELSKGTAQRVGLAQSILTAHRLTIFDEPTHGLDPAWTLAFRDLVFEHRSSDRLIVIASHNLDELERLADRVVILGKGQCLNIIDLRAAADLMIAYQLIVNTGEEFVAACFPDAVVLGEKTFGLPRMDSATLNQRLRKLLDMGGEISEVGPLRSRLEQHFREAVAP